MNNNSKGLSIAALVCGILGIIGSFIPIVCYVTFILAILGIVFGVKARKTALPGETGLATACDACIFFWRDCLDSYI